VNKLVAFGMNISGVVPLCLSSIRRDKKCTLDVILRRFSDFGILNRFQFVKSVTFFVVIDSCAYIEFNYHYFFFPGATTLHWGLYFTAL